MKEIVFFDDLGWENLLPLTLTRPSSEIRIGILTIREKWEKVLGKTSSWKTQGYLSEKFLFAVKHKSGVLYINGRVCPNEILVSELKKLEKGYFLVINDTVVAYLDRGGKLRKSASNATVINFPWDIFVHNGVELERDFQLLTRGRKSQEISKSNRITGKGKIFLEAGVVMEACVLNPMGKVIYLGKNAMMMEGTLVRGGLSVGEESHLKMGTRIYGPCTIGPNCRVGGEVSNSVIFGFSNKAHDGFLGNSVLGEWCNLGADTNTSNLKNNYSEVRVYNYKKEDWVGTGLQFCGLIMGDHSKSSINTMLNTGTVVGVNVNLFGGDFPPKHIPSFSWYGGGGNTRYQFGKAMAVAREVMARRGQAINKIEEKILRHIYDEKRGGE